MSAMLAGRATLLLFAALVLREAAALKVSGKPRLSIRIQPRKQGNGTHGKETVDKKAPKGGFKFGSKADHGTNAKAAKAKTSSAKAVSTSTAAPSSEDKILHHSAFQHSMPCFDLSPGEGVTVQAQHQKFGSGGYLLSLPPGAADPVGEKALVATYEALLGNCKKQWLVDVGAGNGQVSALAASLGCKVAAFDPDVKDIHALSMSHCLNHWTETFAIFPTMAAATPGGNLTIIPAGDNRPMNATNSSENGTEHVIHGVTLDGVMMSGTERQYSLDSANKTPGWDDKIALLKITPQECCTTDTTGKAVNGARQLLNSGRVQCMTLELGFDRSTPDVIATLDFLEQLSYKLAHTGPMGSTLEIGKRGAYVLYSTSAAQLREVDDRLKMIRKFDERSGIRAYGNGLSLNRDGQYFEYGELVVACQKAFPEKLEVRQPGKVRFGGGMWWLDEANATGTANHSSKPKKA